ncbi:MAG: aconitase family protein, partial [Pseudomonadota bacterium]
EFSAFTGLIAPDEKTISYLAGRPYAPVGNRWDEAVEHWRALRSDDEATFDKVLSIDVSEVPPTVTWGISPQHAVAVTDGAPELDTADSSEQRAEFTQAMDYMGLKPGQPLIGLPIDGAFIGSCTNARLSDLRSAAAVLKGRRVAEGVRAICTPASAQVKQAAEREGLDQVFTGSGFEWREPGCSLCFNAGGEGFGPEQRVVSSTNRNFRGRQGPRTRTHLASPASVAAAAVAGCIADVRQYQEAAA